MYDISKDYLNKLIGASGIKLGTAKQQAMTAIIELLDENSLNGLIASIKADYEEMAKAVRDKDEFMRNCERERKNIERQAESRWNELSRLRAEVQKKKEELEALREEKKETALAFDASIAGCGDAEKSRIMAYRVAIELGKSQFDGRMTDETMKQILRSASNVAANWEHQKSTAME